MYDVTTAKNNETKLGYFAGENTQLNDYFSICMQTKHLLLLTTVLVQ